MSESKPKMFGVLTVIALVICLAFGANAWKTSLTIKQINVEGNRIVSLNEIIQLSQVPLGTLLYKVDLTSVQQNVMSHHYVKDAIVERNLPNALNIHIIERTPIAMVNLTEPFYLDEEGVVLPKIAARKIVDLPMISGISSAESFALGSKMKRADELEALQLLALLRTVDRPMYHNISEIAVRNGGDLVLYSAEGGVPIIFGRGELSDKLVRLETFWNTVVRTQGVQYLEYVDVRYRDQVVARWNHEQSAAMNM